MIEINATHTKENRMRYSVKQRKIKRKSSGKNVGKEILLSREKFFHYAVGTQREMVVFCSEK